MAYLNNLKGIADRVNKMDAEKNFNLIEIDIKKLIPSTNNFYGIREIEELSESIKENGLMHNLVVRKLEDGNYEILSGERRYSALKLLGYKKVPCQVKDISELDGEILLIQANSKQRELTHIEKMKGIERLKELYKLKKANGEEIPKGKTRDLIGKDIGLSGVQVGRYMKVSEKLIEPLKDKLEEGKITLTQADTLSSLKDTEQKAILNQIDSNTTKITNAEIDILVEGIKQPVENSKDRELLNELNKDEEVKDIEGIREVLDCLEEYKTPMIIISTEWVKANLYTQSVKFNENRFEIIMSGFVRNNKFLINTSKITKVTEVSINDKKVMSDKLFKIAPGYYMCF